MEGELFNEEFVETERKNFNLNVSMWPRNVSCLEKPITDFWDVYESKETKGLYAFEKEILFDDGDKRKIIKFLWEGVDITDEELDKLNLSVWQCGPDGDHEISTDAGLHRGQWCEITRLRDYLNERDGK